MTYNNVLIEYYTILQKLNNQSFGFPAKLAKLLGDFLFKAVYRIKTGMGIFIVSKIKPCMSKYKFYTAKL